MLVLREMTREAARRDLATDGRRREFRRRLTDGVSPRWGAVCRRSSFTAPTMRSSSARLAARSSREGHARDRLRRRRVHWNLLYATAAVEAFLTKAHETPELRPSGARRSSTHSPHTKPPPLEVSGVERPIKLAVPYGTSLRWPADTSSTRTAATSELPGQQA